MVHVNGKKVGGNDAVTKFTAYVSPYFVVSNGGAYTKHIYAASQRIASKLGNEDGFGADPRRVEQAGGKKYSDIQKDNIGARFEELGYRYNGNNQTETEKDSTMDSEAEEKLIFFYHPDHLGSTSYVTDADGNIAQHVEYIPYGEVFVEERNSQFSTNYLFNAKELDNETGLYYYGARYLDPTGAMWLSVDPMWEKYAGMSPYNYCAGNPVKMVDPDGRENTIYLVNLQEEDKIGIQRYIDNVNDKFDKLGLNTRMTLAPDGQNFDPGRMDNTDSYAVLGSVDKVRSFISERCSEKFFNDQFGNWYGGSENPERSSAVYPPQNNGKFGYVNKTNEIALDADAISKAYSKYGSKDAVSFATYLTLHAAGHNASIRHPDSNNGESEVKYSNGMIMISGNGAYDEFLTGHIKSVDNLCDWIYYDPIRKKVWDNSKYIEIMRSHFGTKPAKANY